MAPPQTKPDSIGHKKQPVPFFRRSRGVALIMAILSIALLTVTAVDFAFNTRVDLELATHQRDELRAYYMAKSAMGLARLLLRFQKQVDSMALPGMNLSSIVGQLPPGLLPPGTDSSSLLGNLGGAAGGAAGQAAGGGGLSLQLWKMVRLDCQLLQGMVQHTSSSKFSFDAESPDAGTARVSFGGFEGCFLASISDEEQKLNANKLDLGALGGQAVVPQFLNLFGDKRFEFLFSREDAQGVKVSPQDLLINLHDWMDADSVQATLNLSGQGEMFQPGFSDENALYSRYQTRYQAKNAPFDTLDELYRVHGFNDRVMAAFRDRLTVYPDINSRLNINTDDPLLLQMAILSVADPNRPDPRLRDVLFVQKLIDQIRTARLMSIFPGMGMSVPQFLAVLQSAGVAVNSSIGSNVQNNRFVSDKSGTFEIRAVGEAGEIQKTLIAVVRPDNALGRLMYWREE